MFQNFPGVHVKARTTDLPCHSSSVCKTIQGGHRNMGHKEPESDTQQSPYVWNFKSMKKINMI